MQQPPRKGTQLDLQLRRLQGLQWGTAAPQCMDNALCAAVREVVDGAPLPKAARSGRENGEDLEQSRRYGARLLSGQWHDGTRLREARQEMGRCRKRAEIYKGRQEKTLRVKATTNIVLVADASTGRFLAEPADALNQNSALVIIRTVGGTKCSIEPVPPHATHAELSPSVEEAICPVPRQTSHFVGGSVRASVI